MEIRTQKSCAYICFNYLLVPPSFLQQCYLPVATNSRMPWAETGPMRVVQGTLPNTGPNRGLHPGTRCHSARLTQMALAQAAQPLCTTDYASSTGDNLPEEFVFSGNAHSVGQSCRLSHPP